MAQFSFDTASAPVASPSTRGPLPDGAYEVVITRSDLKVTKAGDGEYIELEMQVTAGDHQGRRHWERLNVNNPNKKAEDIARGALRDLCLALGITNMQNTTELHDIPFLIEIELDHKDQTRNKIVGYKSAGAAARKPAAPAAPSRPAAPAGARPWAR